MIDYYELLEISRHASKEVVEKAYKALIKKYHPDVAPADKKTEYEEKLKQINLAYETIIDDDKRREYDQKLGVDKEETKTETTKDSSGTTVTTQTIYRTDDTALKYEEEKHRQEMENLKSSYDRYIQELTRNVYGDNYYYEDKRTFKEKFEDFKYRFIKKAKLVLLFILALAITLGLAMLNKDSREEILKVFGWIADFIKGVIENFKIT